MTDADADSEGLGLASLLAIKPTAQANLAEERELLEKLQRDEARARDEHQAQLLRTSHANELVVSLERKLHITRNNVQELQPSRT